MVLTTDSTFGSVRTMRRGGDRSGHRDPFPDAHDGPILRTPLQVDDALIWTSRDGVSWEFQEELELSGVRVAATGQVPLAAVGRHVLLADTRSDPTEPDGLRQVVFVGVIEP